VAACTDSPTLSSPYLRRDVVLMAMTARDYLSTNIIYLLLLSLWNSGIYDHDELNSVAVIVVLILLHRCGIAADLPLRTLRGSPSDRRTLHLRCGRYLSSISQICLVWLKRWILLLSSIIRFRKRYVLVSLVAKVHDHRTFNDRQSSSQEACKKSQR
jgi:hypothetical protein